jgi:pimeloyl-ACP methyl ester carboxylesterase
VTRGHTALLLTAIGAGLAVPASADAKLRFRNCEEGGCARLSVPLDHSGAVSGRLSLRVELHPTFDRPKRGVTLLLAGSPGQAATQVSEYGWEVPGRDLVVFDQRGTGAGALRCRDLEAATETDAGREAAACATLLGDRRAFFRTTDTVEDIELLRTELGIDRLAIVGTDYGAYVAQRYALSYPDRVERLLLESPVDAAGVDPLYLDSVAALRRTLPALCRSTCDSFTNDVVADTARLVERLAAEPLRGRIVDPRGRGRGASLTRQELLYSLIAGNADFVSLPAYPAAMASALRGDTAPILRLKRRATARPAFLGPSIASPATHAATICEEVRFPWSWNATPAERDEAAYRTETAMDRSLAAPFDPATLVRSDLMRLCRRWPTASSAPPPEPGAMPDVPALVIAAPEAARASLKSARRAAARFPRGKLLEAPRVVQLFGSGSSSCADRAGERFLLGRQVQDRCPRQSKLPPVSPPPRALSQLAPVAGVPGRRGRLLGALGATFGDVVDSFYLDGFLGAGLDESGSVIRGGGLRGGSFAVGENVFRLSRWEYVPGVRLSGRWKTEGDGPERLRIDGPGRLDGVVRFRQIENELIFRVRGTIAGRRVRARVPVHSYFIDAINQGESGGEAGRLASRAPRAPNVHGDAPGSCRLSPLRHLSGACAVR